MAEKNIIELAKLREILASEGRTPVQGALAWAWARSDRAIPIPGFRTIEHVKENVQAMEFRSLKPEQMKQINEILGREV